MLQQNNEKAGMPTLCYILVTTAPKTKEFPTIATITQDITGEILDTHILARVQHYSQYPCKETLIDKSSRHTVENNKGWQSQLNNAVYPEKSTMTLRLFHTTP